MKIITIAGMTFREAVRQPAGLVLCFLVAILMLSAPAYSIFALGSANDLLRTSLLSTHILSGVIFVSFITTSLFHAEISNKTIIALLSKPVHLGEYYVGKLLGILATLIFFYAIIVMTGMMSTIISVMETASTKVNLIPLYLLVAGFVLLGLMAFACNYLFNTPIVSFFFLGWGALAPIVLVLTYILSPVFALPLIEIGVMQEYLKSSLILLGLLIAMASLSVACSSFSGPVTNLCLALGFLMLGLAGPGLYQIFSDISPMLQSLSKVIPNLHHFWVAEMITVGNPISLSYLGSSLLYAIMLSVTFSCMGIFILLGKEYS